MLGAVCALLALVLHATLASAAAVPHRVVSFNICSDQLVLALADPDQIAGLSPYASDPDLSVLSDEAAKYPHAEWQAESVVSLKPDLVLVSQGDRAITRQMLDSLGYRVEQISLITDIDAARQQVTQVAELLGHPERGQKLVAEIDAARARLAAVPHPAGATALLVGHGGYTSGPESLAASLVAAAGLHPPQGSPGGYGGFLPLEMLVLLRPDYLIVANAADEENDQGSLYLTHPASRILYPRWRRIILPSRYTLCGGPALVAALDYLTGVMTRVSERTPNRK